MANDLKPIDWKALIAKYDLDGKSGILRPISFEEFQTDLDQVLQYAYILHKQNEKVTEALDGIKESLMAIAKMSGGSVDVPFELTESLGKEDALVVEDLLREDGETVKRFTYVSEKMVAN